MKYPGNETKIKGLPRKCANCGNSEILEGSYCKACGSIIINTCSNNKKSENKDLIYDICGIRLDNNARYCHKCGSPSVFLQNELIKPYFDELRAIVKDKKHPDYQEAKDYLDKYEDEDDDDLPF